MTQPVASCDTDHGPVRTEKQTLPNACALIAIEPNKPDIQDALQGPNTEDWHAAMDAEVAQLQKLNMFELVPLPAERKIIGCCWVLATKRNSDGEIIKFKAWLVAQGFSQVPGMDYDETFLPVMQLESF